MRKTIIGFLGVAMLAGALAAPALAGKVTKGTFTATAAPYPMVVDVDPSGCLNSTEGVHKVTKVFKAPGAGKLTVALGGFTGDWDLYVTDTQGGVLASSTGDQTAAMTDTGSDPLTEQLVLPVASKKTLNIVACNWAGSPQATGKYKFVAR